MQRPLQPRVFLPQQLWAEASWRFRRDQRRNDQNIADSRHKHPETWVRIPQAPALANGVERGLTAKGKRDHGQSSQRLDSESHPEFTDSQHGRAKKQKTASHNDACHRQFADSPGTSPAAGTVAQTLSRRTEAFSERQPRLERSQSRLSAPFLEESESGVEDQENRDDRSLDVLAEDNLEHDRGLEHPGNRRPELGQRPA